jgi:cell division inhibitor SepF
MMIVKPSAYDEVQEIADHLKNRRPIIVNLEDTEKELAQRIVDFISGTTYAINGNLQKVSAGIFVFAPPNVDLQGAYPSDKEKNFLNWGR